MKPGKAIRSLIFSCFSLVGWLAVFILIAATLWNHYGPEKPVPDKLRQDMGKKFVASVTKEIQAKRGNIKRVVMLHFANDPNGYITDSLRSKINSSGILNLEEPFLLDKFRSKLNLRNEGIGSQAEALKAVKGQKIDGVLWGNIEKYESFEGAVIMKADWQLVDVKSGEVVCSGTFDEDTSKKLPAQLDQKLKDINKELEPVAKTTQVVPWYIRFLIFLLVILMLPIFTISFLRLLVAKHSNGINAVVLGVYTLIGAILAFFMIGAAFSSIWVTLLFIIATVLAFLYNLMMMNFALKLES